MARSLSTAVKQALNAQETAEVFLILLTINHVDLATPIRVVRNLEDVTSGGDLYVGLPFDIDLPVDREDEIPKATLRIDNVDRAIVDAVRSITTPPTVTLEIVRAAAPDDIEITLSGFTLRDVSYDALVVEGTIRFEEILAEPFPAHSITPADFPGVF